MSAKDIVKPYYGSQRVSASCRPHGGCPHCLGNRRHQESKEQARADDSQREASE
jgi:hypothetical protein